MFRSSGGLLGPPGNSWGRLGPPVASWGLLCVPGASWGFLGPPGASCWVSWAFLGPPGASWGLLRPSGGSWASPAPLETPWGLLKPPGASCGLPEASSSRTKTAAQPLGRAGKFPLVTAIAATLVVVGPRGAGDGGSEVHLWAVTNAAQWPRRAAQTSEDARAPPTVARAMQAR